MYHHVLPLVSHFEKIDCQASRGKSHYFPLESVPSRWDPEPI